MKRSMQVTILYEELYKLVREYVGAPSGVNCAIEFVDGYFKDRPNAKVTWEIKDE